MSKLFVLAALCSAVLSIPSNPTKEPPSAKTNCQDVSFGTLLLSAENRKANVQPDFSTFEGAVAFLNQSYETTLVRGRETIYGRYCTSTDTRVNIVATKESQTLQILVHGNTYDSTYFSGLGQKQYSWEAYANSLGYNTLAIDRVGNGRSSHPDPTTHVQAPYQVEVLHSIIQQIRNSNVLPQTPRNISLVGHSYGSILANNLAAKYPDDVDVFLLTGIAIPKPGDFALPGQFQMGFKSASDYDPARFPNYPKGYLVTSNKAGRMNTFYSEPGVDFDTAIYDRDFATMGTISTGEAFTQNLFPAQTFNGGVFVLTGQQDATFCGNGTRVPTPPDCGSGSSSQLATVQVLFPSAGAFDYFAQPKAGHCHNTHFTAQQGFEKAHEFLSNWLYHGVRGTAS